jgi:hypothetical protein
MIERFSHRSLHRGFPGERSRLHGRKSRRSLGDSCGCAMGARFLAAALVGSIVWYAWRRHGLMLSVWVIVLRVLLWCVVASVAGKIVGILVFRSRAQRHLGEPHTLLRL